MKESTSVEYGAIVDAINAHELSKEDILCLMDDKYASKKLSTQEYFDLMNKVDMNY